MSLNSSFTKPLHIRKQWYINYVTDYSYDLTIQTLSVVFFSHLITSCMNELNAFRNAYKNSTSFTRFK